jgi:hypothetical protein
MTFPEAFYFAMIVCVGVPSAFRLNARVRNPTALAMVATWFACRMSYEASGETMPRRALVLSDIAVVTTIYCKQVWRTCSYATLRLQLVALWFERSPWDRAILAIFPFVWLFYAPILEPKPQYWVLWSLSLAQLMLAGAEALHLHRGQMAIKSRADAPERPPPRQDFYAPAAGGGYG